MPEDMVSAHPWRNLDSTINGWPVFKVAEAR
jgi:hypothetical protein